MAAPLPPDPAGGGAQDAAPVGGRYAKYVLGVLVLVYIFNFVDRQILSILAEEIKADIGISDAQLGFLYGTAFAVFYAVFGIPLGRLGDVWVRKSLISIGLAFWSLMTALSGTARSFLTLGTFRIGVGVGEASATPAAFSMLSDYFPPSQRATALAVYSSGVYIGAGIGIFLGGWVVDAWAAAFPGGDSPFGLRGWQAAFFVVGLPGVIMALWVGSLREPIRGQSEGITVATPHPHPFRELGLELAAVLPPLTLRTLWRAGVGPRGMLINLGFATAVAAAALGGWMGVTAGGYLSDVFKRRRANARLYMGYASVVLSVPVGLWLLSTDNLYLAYALNFVFAIVSPLWIGGAATLVNELVMPRMRGTASAFYILMITFIGLALGPYSIGKLSDALAQGGMLGGEALRTAMMVGLAPFALTLLFLFLASRHIKVDEDSRLERALAAGEPAGR